MFRKVKINNEKVNVIKTTEVPPDKIRGYSLFDQLYCNIFVCAKTKSGKTNVLFKILKECTNKDTGLIFFSSTAYNDENMMHIIKYFKKRCNPIKIHTDIVEDDTDMMRSYLDSFKLINKDTIDAELNTEKKGEIKLESYILCDPIEQKQEEKKRKPKKIAPEVILIMDDMSDDMKTRAVDKWLKMSRHFKAKTLISSQWINDISPSSRKQIHYCLLFQGHSIEKLETIHNDLSLNLPIEQFIAVYNDATTEKYNFLYIDVKNNSYRQNFNIIYEL